MIKLRIKGLRATIAQWAPGIVVALWGLFSFDGQWFARLFSAVAFGFFAQLFGVLAYYITVYTTGSLSGERRELDKIDLNDRRVSAALLLTAFVYVLGQHWRNDARATIARCVREETRASAFGEFDNAVDLVQFCTEEYGREDLSSDE
jgi:hypothetical protein